MAVNAITKETRKMNIMGNNEFNEHNNKVLIEAETIDKRELNSDCKAAPKIRKILIRTGAGVIDYGYFMGDFSNRNFTNDVTYYADETCKIERRFIIRNESVIIMDATDEEFEVYEARTKWQLEKEQLINKEAREAIDKFGGVENMIKNGGKEIQGDKSGIQPEI